MSHATIKSLAIRTTVSSVFASTILSILASATFAGGPAPIVIPLPVPGAPVMETILEPSPTAPLIEFLQVNIRDAVFLFAPTVPPTPAGAEVDLLETIGTAQVISDRILFDNSFNGTATITFLSDDEQGNLPTGPHYPLLIPPVLAGELATITLPIIPGSLPPVTLTVTMISDGDPTLPPQGVSDALVFKTPEPGTIFLAAIGLISLGAIAYRRRAARVA